MTPDELRALADALLPMAAAPCFDGIDVERAADYLRACADVQPVAWRDHVEQRIRGWRQRTMNRSGDRLALDDMMGQESIDDLIDYVCDEWSDPAPAAPQAGPKREPLSDEWLARKAFLLGIPLWTLTVIVRAVECAHEIGGSDD